MFEKGKQYRIKTIEEMLELENSTLAGDYIDVSGQPSFVIKEMGEYCGLLFIAHSTDEYLELFGWNWAPYMVEVLDKKIRLLNMIKDFK